MIPLIKAKAIDLDEIVVDAKSGMTGAGRAAKEAMLFSEVSEGFHAYGVGHHRHMAELDQEFSVAAGREVIVLEAEHAFGTATSARNSEVIHAGIYYPQGSLKARVRRDAANPACARL